MEFTKEQRDEIERKLVEAIITSLEQQVLSEEELPTVASFILERLETVATRDDLLLFLRELSAKWNIFTHILVLESGEVKERMEDSVVDQVLELAKKGEINEAVELAKTATKS